MIRDGEHDEIGAEKLRGLLKILPEFDELEMLKNFEGDKCRLGNAEKFLMQLLQVPKYASWLIEGSLTCCVTFDDFKGAFKCFSQAMNLMFIHDDFSLPMLAE